VYWMEDNVLFIPRYEEMASINNIITPRKLK
jgi:hypothetical protein